MAKQNQNKNDTTALTFEDAIKELNTIVARIEQGQISLDDSLQNYEKGMALIAHCRQVLQKAEKRIEKISADKKSSSNRKTEQ